MTRAPMTSMTLSRWFDAPRSVVYRAFTEADQLAAWFGPVGFSVPSESVSVEARVGGHQRLTMVSDADPTFTSPLDATFTEVVPDERLVGTTDVTGIPGFEGIEGFTLTLDFSDEDGGTRLEVCQGPYTAEMAAGAGFGWESSFTKLDKVLAGVLR